MRKEQTRTWLQEYTSGQGKPWAQSQLWLEGPLASQGQNIRALLKTPSEQRQSPNLTTRVRSPEENSGEEREPKFIRLRAELVCDPTGGYCRDTFASSLRAPGWAWLPPPPPPPRPGSILRVEKWEQSWDRTAEMLSGSGLQQRSELPAGLGPLKRQEVLRGPHFPAAGPVNESTRGFSSAKAGRVQEGCEAAATGRVQEGCETAAEGPGRWP